MITKIHIEFEFEGDKFSKRDIRKWGKTVSKMAENFTGVTVRVVKVWEENATS